MTPSRMLHYIYNEKYNTLMFKSYPDRMTFYGKDLI